MQLIGDSDTCNDTSNIRTKVQYHILVMLQLKECIAYLKSLRLCCIQVTRDTTELNILKAVEPHQRTPGFEDMNLALPNHLTYINGICSLQLSCLLPAGKDRRLSKTNFRQFQTPYRLSSLKEVFPSQLSSH